MGVNQKLTNEDFQFHADQSDVPQKTAEEMKELFDAPIKTLMKKINEIIGEGDAVSLSELKELLAKKTDKEYADNLFRGMMDNFSDHANALTEHITRIMQAEASIDTMEGELDTLNASVSQARSEVESQADADETNARFGAISAALDEKAPLGELSEVNTALGNCVKNTDIATVSKAGVVRVNKELGINIINGLLILSEVKKDMIYAKENKYYALTPSNIDDVVKAGLISNALEWSETEKAAARELLGITDSVSDSVSGGVAPSEFATLYEGKNKNALQSAITFSCGAAGCQEVRGVMQIYHGEDAFFFQAGGVFLKINDSVINITDVTYDITTYVNEQTLMEIAVQGQYAKVSFYQEQPEDMPYNKQKYRTSDIHFVVPLGSDRIHSLSLYHQGGVIEGTLQQVGVSLVGSVEGKV